jgi:predicted dehydrogenase
MRVGLIGCGIAGRSHLLDVVTNPRFDVRALATRRHRRAREVAAEFAVPAFYTDVAAMLATQALDAVVVATPPAVTPAVLRMVLDHSPLVLVDKPAGASAPDLRPLLEDARGRVVVGYNRRYQTHVQHCRDLLTHAGPGVVRRVRCTWHAPFADRYRSAATYRYTAGFGHGVLLDTASHILDTLAFLGLGTGTVEAARAQAGGASGADIDAALRLTLPGGAPVLVSIRNDDTDPTDRWHIDITGTAGRLELTRDALTGCWDHHRLALGAADIRRPVDDLLALADRGAVSGATLAEATDVLDTLDTARQHLTNGHDLMNGHETGRRRWQRPRAKALGRLNGAC